MIAHGFDAHSRIKTLTAAGVAETRAGAVFNMVAAPPGDGNGPQPRDSDLHAARIAAAEFKAQLFKWSAAAVCAGGAIFNAIVVFSTVVRLGNSLHH
jgi:hypothetical protein